MFLVGLGGTHVVFGSDSVITHAIRFEDYQSYDDAITEYKRFIFLNPGHSERAYCFYRMGLAFRSIGKLNKACESFKTAIKLSPTDSLRDDARIRLATTLVASGNHSLARYQLLKLTHLSKLHSTRRRALFFEAINNLYLFDWKAAHEGFRVYFSECQGEDCAKQAARVLPLLRNCTSLPYRSPGKAAVLSTLVPGLGQTYAGNYWQGLNAFVLNSIIAVLIVDSASQKNYFDTALFFSLFVRFFSGNRQSAKELAESHNLIMNRARVSQILNVLASKE